MKTTEETVGVGQQIVSFGQATIALNQGKRVRFIGWNENKKFIFKQIPSEVPAKFVPNMSSLPSSVKDYFNETFEKEQIDAIYYNNQIALVSASNVITGWSPSVEEAMSENWIILD